MLSICCEEFFLLELVLFELFGGGFGDGLAARGVRREPLGVVLRVEAGVLSDFEHGRRVDRLGGVLLGELRCLLVLARASGLFL